MILVTIDCLRADHLGCYGYDRKTSPFLDSLSAKGMKFQNAFANGPFTAASFLSILASAYPLEFSDQLPLPLGAVLVSEVLRKEGIRTAAIHSNPYLSGIYGYARGWDYFQDFLPRVLNKDSGTRRTNVRRSVKNYLPKRILGLYRLSNRIYHLSKAYLGIVKSYESAETITRSAITWLDDNKESRFFLWIHYMDLHEPYLAYDRKLSREYSKNMSMLSQITLLENLSRGRVQLEEAENIINIYDDKLRYIDMNVEKLSDFLGNEGLLECTFMIITSDHGQEFLDHGAFGHTARFYDEILHIPLILSGPGMEKQVKRNLVSQLDIAPTIISLYGVSIPESYRGHDLLSKHTDRYVISEAAHNEEGHYIRSHKILPSDLRTYAIRTEQWKYVRRDRHQTLFNLKKDPKEEDNVVDKERAERENLEAIIRQHTIWETEIRRSRAAAYRREKIRKRIERLRSVRNI